MDWPRDLLIDAARQRARGISWELIAEDTPHSAGELCRFTVKRPEAWRPLYVRAEKLRLQEAEGQTLAHLTALLKGDDETAAEKAGRELLLHRRHIERRRTKPQRHRDLPAVAGTENQEGLNAAEISCDTGGPARDLEEFSVPQCLCGEKEVPGELEIALLAAARGFALGEETGSIARETGRAAEEIARWAFVYAKAWDRAYHPARVEAAEFGAALAINRLLDFIAGPDANLAARAGRTLLIHRRHMHWARNTQPPRHQDTKNLEGLSAAEGARETSALSRDPGSNLVPSCLLLCEVARYVARVGGEKESPPWRPGGERERSPPRPLR